MSVGSSSPWGFTEAIEEDGGWHCLTRGREDDQAHMQYGKSDQAPCGDGGRRQAAKGRESGASGSRAGISSSARSAASSAVLIHIRARSGSLAQSSSRPTIDYMRLKAS